MIDSIAAILWAANASGVSFMEIVPPRLLNCEHKTSKRTGEPYTVGYLPNPYCPTSYGFTVTVSNEYVRIDHRSLCKWWLGNNLRTMTHKDIVQAFCLIGQLLGVPVENARIARLDIAHNIIVDHPPKTYLNYLGDMSHKERVRASTTALYYKTSQFEICVYDKIKELRKHKEPIPPEWLAKQVLRFEIRYLKNVSRQFGRKRLTVEMLCRPELYAECVQRWAEAYRNIHKLKDVAPNFDMITTVTDLNNQGVATFVRECGGEMAFIEQINTAQAMGKLNPQQAKKLRDKAKAACANPIFARPSGLIAELDGKIEDAVESLMLSCR